MTEKKLPAYKIVYKGLKKKIQQEYSIGDLLPPEPELEKQYNVSRITIRKAIQMLSDEGWVSVRQGQGTKVTDPGTVQRSNSITSQSETLRGAGYVVQTVDIHMDTMIPDKEIADLMQIPEGAAVTRLQRLIAANGKPVSIMTNYIMPEFADGLADHLDNFDGLYNFLEKNNDVRFETGVEYITASTASFTQARVLGIPIGSPLLHAQRVTFMGGKTVTCDDIYTDASRYKVSIHLAGRSPRQD